MTNGSGLVRDIGWCECFFFFFFEIVETGSNTFSVINSLNLFRICGHSLSKNLIFIIIDIVNGE